MNYENDSKSLKLDRSILQIKEHEFVEYNKKIYKISSIIDFSNVIGIDVDTKRPKRLPIHDLKSIPLADVSKDIAIYKDTYDYSNDELKEIEKKLLAIQPILTNSISREEIEKHSNEIGVHFTTLYRWVKKYKSTGSYTGLLPRPSGRKLGETRLDYQTEEIMQNIINHYYLTKQKPSIQSVIDKIQFDCQKQGIPFPSKNTIRNRIHKLYEYDVLKKQGNRSKARTKFNPAPGNFTAQYPLQLIEMDHTLVDVILVDDDHREPIGRPWITIAIDIYSRMIVGYYLSLNPPSVTSVAMCITNAVLPKEKTLLDLNIDSNWDVWGFPETIHVDNGADFRAEAIRDAGLIHGINIEFRPVGRANFGGHIERVIGTLMKAVHLIPGTTFSNIQQKGEYNSDKHSTMTFSEFERWIITFITKIYHKRMHSEIKMSPEELWEEGIFGENSPMGLPPKPSDPLSILIDFLPFFKRSIQKNGVNIEGINYYDHLLRNKINMIDSITGKKKQFIFKRDPKNIKYIWFYDDSIQEYFQIPSADQSLPDMTLWQFDLIKKHLRKKGIKKINSYQISAAHEELHQQIEDSVTKTKKLRRAKQRLKNKDVELKKLQKQDVEKSTSTEQKIYVQDDIWDADVPDFG